MVLDALGWFADAMTRFYWGTTKWAWDLVMGSKVNGTQVRCSWVLTEELQPSGFNTQVVAWVDTGLQPNQIWRLIPSKVEGAPAPSYSSSSETLGSGFLPSYGGDATAQSSARAEQTESEPDDFGMIVTEVTTVTTVTTRT